MESELLMDLLHKIADLERRVSNLEQQNNTPYQPYKWWLYPGQPYQQSNPNQPMISWNCEGR